ncbi:MAG: cytochrome c oxidase assembly protein [Actinomycetota bacterium]|nr:cytochrome c oxidase assembly protein [Actinomycetota bacterium]
MVALSLTPMDLITKVNFAPGPAVGLALGLLLYLGGVRRLAAKGRSWPRSRTLAFASGSAMLAFALLSGLASYDDTNFTIHVIQHMLIGMLAPILLALSAPITLAIQAGDRRTQTAILRTVHSLPMRVLSNPVVTWGIFGGSLFVLYFTNLYAYSLHHSVVHDLIHLHFIAAGALFYWPVVGIDPIPHRMHYGFRIVYLFMALPFHTVLGMALISQDHAIASGISLQDLHTGGGLMWAGGEMIGLIAGVAVLVQWLRAEERAVRRSDRTTEDQALAQAAAWRATGKGRPGTPVPARPAPGR